MALQQQSPLARRPRRIQAAYWRLIGAQDLMRWVDTQSSMTANASGNFASNFAGKNFRDILDGGDSESSTAQFYGVILGGVFPTERNGI